jgi:sec-independent protein translocase protein TatB
LKRSFNAIKQEVEREIGADEIRRQLHNEHILSLEQEARKIFTPTQQEATPVQPVEPVAEQTIHAPVAAEPAPVVAAVEPAPVVAATPVEPVTPAAAPVASAPHDPTLPPRAP